MLIIIILIIIVIIIIIIITIVIYKKNSYKLRIEIINLIRIIHVIIKIHSNESRCKPSSTVGSYEHTLWNTHLFFRRVACQYEEKGTYCANN